MRVLERRRRALRVALVGGSSGGGDGDGDRPHLSLSTGPHISVPYRLRGGGGAAARRGGRQGGGGVGGRRGRGRVRFGGFGSGRAVILSSCSGVELRRRRRVAPACAPSRARLQRQRRRRRRRRPPPPPHSPLALTSRCPTASGPPLRWPRRRQRRPGRPTRQHGSLFVSFCTVALNDSPRLAHRADLHRTGLHRAGSRLNGSEESERTDSHRASRFAQAHVAPAHCLYLTSTPSNCYSDNTSNILKL